MRSTVELVSSARRELKELPERVRDEILDVLDSLSTEDPRKLGRSLVGHRDLFRIRVGQYRLIYKLTRNGRVVVTRIRHRSEVYGGMGTPRGR